MFTNNYPYTDFHELNLDWFLEQFKTLQVDWEKIKPLIPGIDKLFVTPDFFGAVGDGIADDSPALQAAVNTGLPVCIPQVPNKVYRIANTVDCPTKTKIFSLTPPHCFYPALEGGGIFVDCAIGFKFNDYCTAENLNLWQSRNAERIYFVTESTDPDNVRGSECRFSNCTFVNGKYAINSKGRGDVVENCYFGIMIAGVCIEYPTTDDGSEYQRYNTGGRGWIITGNKFHGCSYTIELKTGYLNDVVITGNNSDVSRTFIKTRAGVTVQSSTITGNSALYLREQFIDCEDNAVFKNVSINGNSAETNIDSTDLPGKMTVAIKLGGGSGIHEGVVIANNALKGGSSFALSIRHCKDMVISGNSITGFTGSNYILADGALERLCITGNIFNSTSTPGAVLHGISTPSLSGSVIIGNVHNANRVNDITTTGTKPNTIQDY